MSEQRDKELASACADGTSSLCRAAIQLATASGNVVFFDQRGAPFAVPADSPMIQVTPDPLDGTWHYTIATSVAEGLAIDSGSGALMGIGSAIRGLFRPGVAEIAVRVKGGLPPLRQECISEVKALEDIALSMRAAGASPEQVARQLHQMRRDLGVQYRDLTPAPQLEAIYARNIEKYSSQCLRRIWV